jgi:hypothetical protein
VIPPPARGYRALRELWNHRARFVSPMAWNGSHGLYVDHPAYVPFTSWRGTPAEQAAKDFMLARAGMPRDSRLWTFGTPAHADRDDWTTALGSTQPQRGSLRVEPGAGARAVLDSPRELLLDASARLVVLASAPVAVEAWGRGPADPPWAWRLLGRGEGAAGTRLPRVDGGIDQLRLALSLPSGAVTITRIALLPVPE